jgi:integrase
MRRRGFADDRSARKALDSVLDRIEAGDEVVTRGRLTVEKYADEWLIGMRVHLSPAGWTNYRDIVRLYVKPHIGPNRLAAVNSQTLTALYADLLASGGRNGKPLSVTSVRLVHRVLSKLFADAREAGLIGANPAARARPPRPQRPQTAVWAPEHARAFLAGVKEERLYPVWLVALTCGLRRGELAGVRWQDVDLDRGHLAVEQQRTTDGDGRLVTKEPKGKSRRTLALGADVVVVLRQLRTRTAAERLALGLSWDDSACLFTHADASPIFPERYTTSFQAAIRRVNAALIEAEQEPLPRIRLHDLRHTAATLMIVQGVHAKVVQERLGHYSASFTMDRYSHVLDTMQQGAADTLDDLLRGTA